MRQTIAVLAALLIFALDGRALAAPAPAISPARCAKNQAAGHIVFLTSFAYAASTGILDVLTAKQLGYFQALCLDVQVQPGGTNAQLVSAGTAQIAGFGDAASLIAAASHGAALTAIATYGNTSAVELIALQQSGVKSPRDLIGKVVGYKLALAPQIAAMFVQAKVPLESVKFVSVGFNPVILSNGSVAAMSGYKSNEPRLLAKAGYRITELSPEAFGIRSTFNVLMTNPAWAAAHRTAVEDFLRATLRAYGWIKQSDANLNRALGFARDLSTAGFDMDASRYRWQMEDRLITASQKPGTVLGFNDPRQWQADADNLLKARLVRSLPRISSLYDNSFVAAIYKKGALQWPAP